MCDMNAKVVQCNSGLERTIGRYGLVTLTKGGQMFTDCCSNYNLFIGGTLFNQKRIHMTTWTSPDRATENQIEHITMVVENGVTPLWTCGKKSNQKAQKQFVDEKLKNVATYSRFTDSLGTAFTSGHAPADEWHKIKQVLLNAAEEHVSYIVNKRKCWIFIAR